MKRGERRLEGVLLLMTVIFASVLDAALIALWFAVPQFEVMLKEFGAELPGLTRFMLEHYRWSLLLMIGVSLACLGLVRHRGETLAQSRPAVLIFSLACGLCMLALGLFVIALYLPIFRLGTLV